MYAIFESGGKQHKVVEGETLRLEKLDAAAGDKVNFDKVLLVNDGNSLNLGAPYVAGGKVTAEVVEQGRGEKVKNHQIPSPQAPRETNGASSIFH